MACPAVQFPSSAPYDPTWAAVNIGRSEGDACLLHEDGCVIEVQTPGIGQPSLRFTFEFSRVEFTDAAHDTIYALGIESVEQIDIKLIVGQASLGTISYERPGLRCADEHGYLDVAVPIDLSRHPALSDLSELDGQAALVEYHLVSGDEQLYQGLLPIKISVPSIR
jgi:hypothetical protein